MFNLTMILRWDTLWVDLKYPFSMPDEPDDWPLTSEHCTIKRSLLFSIAPNLMVKFYRGLQKV